MLVHTNIIWILSSARGNWIPMGTGVPTAFGDCFVGVGVLHGKIGGHTLSYGHRSTTTDMAECIMRTGRGPLKDQPRIKNCAEPRWPALPKINRVLQPGPAFALVWCCDSIHIKLIIKLIGATSRPQTFQIKLKSVQHFIMTSVHTWEVKIAQS